MIWHAIRTLNSQDVTGTRQTLQKVKPNVSQHARCVREPLKRSIAFNKTLDLRAYLIQMWFEMIESFLIWKCILLS